MKILSFGTRGIWHTPSSEEGKKESKDMVAVVLEHTDIGALYIFTEKPLALGHDNLTGRTFTILPSDFTPDEIQPEEKDVRDWLTIEGERNEVMAAYIDGHHDEIMNYVLIDGHVNFEDLIRRLQRSPFA